MRNANFQPLYATMMLAKGKTALYTAFTTTSRHIPHLRFFKPSIRQHSTSTDDEESLLDFSASSIASIAHKVLYTADPEKKISLTHKARKLFDANYELFNSSKAYNDTSKQFLSFIDKKHDHELVFDAARPEKPVLVDPQVAPSHKQTGLPLNVHLLHSIAHVELNAIDLSWHMILAATHNHFNSKLFSGVDEDDGVTKRTRLVDFCRDWVTIGDDEARHFMWLFKRLKELDYYYGCIPAHNNLWMIAKETAHDIKAKLAVIPLVLEARALDAGPKLKNRLISLADKESALIVERICNEEVEHVAIGVKWFQHFCEREQLNTISTYHELVKKYIVAPLPSQFNYDARSAANFPKEWYYPLSDKVRPREAKATRYKIL